ncbi:MAG: hypothetical protein RI933_226 [Actinomycetota bacterium]|jgi:uncharacterized protein (DUF305 family)
MKTSTIRTIAVSGTILLASLSLAGCTINLGTNGSNDDNGMMGNNGMMSQSKNDSSFSGSDIMFAQMMIPHHQQAVDMGTLAETRAQSPEVKALAAQIKSEQSPEITQMKGWLKEANAPLEMGHDMGMGGMLTDAQMTALKNATGSEFDKLYLEGMIAHHEGAIHMAQMVTDSANPEAKALGKAIIESQTKQIEYMKSLLAK